MSHGGPPFRGRGRGGTGSYGSSRDRPRRSQSAHSGHRGRGYTSNPMSWDRENSRHREAGKSWRIYFGFTRLTELQTKESNEILLTFTSRQDSLQEALNDTRHDDKMIHLILRCSAKACQSSSSLPQKILEFLRMFEDSKFFRETLFQYLMDLKTQTLEVTSSEDVLLDVFVIFSEFKKRMPHTTLSFFGVSALIEHIYNTMVQTCSGVSQQLASAYKDWKDAKELVSKQTQWRQNRNQRADTEDAWQPPEDFRNIPVYPEAIDIKHHELPFLRRNKIQGRYIDLNHYLDVQFRLLREDFIAPLRDGVSKYIEAITVNGQVKRLQDVRIYTDVQLVSPVCNNLGLCQRVRFDCPGFKRIRWESSKRLIFGSLVVLSSDTFETFLFATVANRDLKEVKRGLVDLHFETEPQTIAAIKPGTNFIMAETSAYFEAYRHVLSGLQNMREGDLPFEKYIVHCETVVDSPAYLRISARMDLRPLVDEDILLRDESRQPRSRTNEGIRPTYTFSSLANRANNVLVTDERRWPEPELLKLDMSQFQAVQMALSKEFVIIQGPPGTGKTYIGLKIVRALLHNKSLWSNDPATKTIDSRPLLVVCYTNHALDQFLEGIIKFFKGDVLRLGGRSSSETMINYGIAGKREALRKSRSLPKAIYVERTRTRLRMKALRAGINVLSERMEKAKMELLHEETLERIIGCRHYRALISGFEFLKKQQLDSENFHTARKKKESAIVEWLGLGQMFQEQNLNKITPVQNNTKQVTTETEYIDVIDEVDAEILQRQTDTFDDDENVNEKDAVEEITNMLTQLGIEKTTVALRVSDMDDSATDGGRYQPKDQSAAEWQIQAHQRRKIKHDLKQALCSSEAMDVSEVSRINNIWSLSKENKWRLYRYWIQQYCNVLQRKVDESEEEFQHICQANLQMQMQEDKEIMRHASVIGMTTTCAAKYQPVLKEIGPKIIVVEEAAEVLEAHVITTLSKKCEHLILIGDHQQLKPNPTVYKLAKHFNLEVSLFERMVKNNLEYICLEQQHRMRPEIAEIMHIIYPNLKNHHLVTTYDEIRGVSRNVFFIEHSNKESSDEESYSHSNDHEAEYISKLCKYLLLQGYCPEQITVLTLYSGQLFNLKQKMPKATFNGVKMTVVDNFQGEENDIILLSLVRSNDKDDIGFLSIENRVCVALSRAKKGFYVIGNFDMLARKNDLWKKIVSLAYTKGFIGDGLLLYCQNHPKEKGIYAVNASDFTKAPEGGCMKPCEFRLNCGHTCPRACHVNDRKHEKFSCTKPCTKSACKRDHKCRGICSQKCPPCQVPVKQVLALCGHTQDVPCSMDPLKFHCLDKCLKVLPCGHICGNLCGESHTDRCQVMVLKKWSCGHSAKVFCFKSEEICHFPCKAELDCGHICKGACGECFEGRMHKACREKCKRTLVCEHTCKDNCSSCPPCTIRCENRCVHSKCQKKCGEPCTPCQEKCDWQCRHFRCSKMCWEPCDRKRCNQRCRSTIKCGHQCIGVCGEPCPALCKICDREKVTEIFFGSEDEPDALFVQLEDCNHLFEISGLDQWMDNENTIKGKTAIKMKECPRCKTPIRRNLRYGNIIKQTLYDIEKIKKHKIGETERICELQRSIITKRRGLPEGDVKIINKNLEKLLYTVVTENNYITIDNQVRLLKALNDLRKTYQESLVKTRMYDREYFDALQHLDQMHAFLMKDRSYFTTQELSDIQTEIERLVLLLKLLKLKEQKAKYALKIDASYSVHFLKAEKYLTDKKRFDENMKNFVTQVITVMECLIPKTGLGINEEERLVILSAMQLSKGHWYKCPNGHVYAIGDCGGATEESVCPECKAVIGGSSHRLRADNAVATEMDGARHSAWSEQNNLANYDPFQIRH